MQMCIPTNYISSVVLEQAKNFGNQTLKTGKKLKENAAIWSQIR
jgi:hypothetical protein